MQLRGWILTILMIGGAGTQARAETMVHDWSQRFGDASFQYVRALAVDADGNTIVAGDFSGSVDFGGGLLVSAGSDIFLAKYDASGSHVWSARFGDAAGQYAYALATDPWGNIAIAGFFDGTVDFGGGGLTTAGGYDVFVAKFDADGNHIWSQGFGDSNSQVAYEAAMDASGNTIITGYYLGTVDFGGGPMPTNGGYDIFVAKFDVSGNHLWSQHYGNNGAQFGRSVTVDAAGNILLAGEFASMVDFGGGALTSGGNYDAYLAKLDADGNHVWSQGFGDTGAQYAKDVAVDGAGNVVLFGEFDSTIDLGGGPLVSPSGNKLFLARFDAAGGHLWSKGFGDANTQYAYEAAVDGAGAVTIVGFFYGTVDFGGGPLTSFPNRDIYVARFDATGSHAWSRRFGSTAIDEGQAVATDPLGNVVMAGHFQGTIDFGGGPLTSAGSYDVFVAKFWRAAPVIHSVRDVPGDQGGVVSLAWDASGADTPAEPEITQYTVWRAIDQSLAAQMVAGGATLSSAPLAPGDDKKPFIREQRIANTTYYWYLVDTYPTYYLPGYSAPVPTLFDSTGVSSEMHYFQVIAHTSNGFVFYVSDPDSGYSVDNLAPAAPLMLTAQRMGNDVLLSWYPSGENEPDLAQYAVYRATASGVTPEPMWFLSNSVDTTLTDTGAPASALYYVVTGIDVHDNEGAASNEAMVDAPATGVGDTPRLTALQVRANIPNPFSGSTLLEVGLPSASAVVLEVYDVTGRRVRHERFGEMPAGWQRLSFDGRDDRGRRLPSGVYFGRISAAGESTTHKMVIRR